MKEITKISAFIILIAAGMILQSCSEDSDPSLAQVNLEMKAQTTQSTLNNGRQMNAGLVFN